MDKLGFTFYPKDWWTSETFFEFTPEQRYIYLECLFIMYSNDGYMKTQKTQLENRLRTQISDEVWNIITEKFIQDDNGYTHASVNKRLRKTIANRENGQKGGRPPKTQITQIENPKKPTLESESESESEKEIEIKEKQKKKKEPSAPVDIYKNIEKHPMQLQMEFRDLNDKIKKLYPGVLNIKNQMSIDQYAELRKDYSMKDIETKLIVIQNRENVQKKNSFVHLTLSTWLRTYPPPKQTTSTQKLNEDGEPIDIVKKYELRNQQLRDANR